MSTYLVGLWHTYLTIEATLRPTKMAQISPYLSLLHAQEKDVIEATSLLWNVSSILFYLSCLRGLQHTSLITGTTLGLTK